MTRKVTLLFSILLMAVVSLASADDTKKIYGESAGALRFYTDYNCFAHIGEADQTFFQLFLYLSRKDLTPLLEEEQYLFSYQVNIKLLDAEDEKNAQERSFEAKVPPVSAEEELEAEVPLLLEVSFSLKPTQYILSIEIIDQNDPNNSGVYNDLIQVVSFKGSGLQISELQLASDIKKGGEPGEMFVKNGYTILPNPPKFFGQNLSFVFFYAEVYNLAYGGDKDPTYDLAYTITDKNDAVVTKGPAKHKKKGGKTAVILEKAKILGLSSGEYKLNVSITDNANSKKSQRSASFLVLREGETAEDVKDVSFFEKLDDKSAETAGNILGFVANKDELKIYNQLTLEGKKAYLEEFWKKKDPDPTTNENEILVQYYKRYYYADKKFSTLNQAGWKTEEARVYIQYGPPDNIERYEFASETIPYRQWYYYQLEGQKGLIVFVFADKQRSGRFELIHSNARDELNNPFWQDEVQKKSSW